MSYLKDIDNKNQIILSDINILKHKKNQLEKINKIQKEQNKSDTKLHNSRKFTQSNYQTNLLKINKNITTLEIKVKELESDRETLEKNNKKNTQINNKYLNNIRNKEKIIFDNLNKQFNENKNSYTKNENLMLELIKAEEDKIQNLQFEINEIIIELDKQNCFNSKIKYELQSKIIIINKKLIKQKKLIKREEKNIITKI